MFLVFASENSSRLAYVIDVICSYAKISYELTSDKAYFQSSKKARLNYSSIPMDGICTIQPSVVLFDKGLPVYGITKGKFEGEECLAFNEVVDPLASIFYMLTRMEEYQSKKFDQHGRFEAVNSISTRFDWLQKAMCDRWANAFLNLLKQEAGLTIEISFPNVTMIPTFDIDNAYAYRHKGKLRKSLSVVKDFLKGDFYRIQQRTKVLLGLKKDPYDTYDKITSIAAQGFPVKLFWLLGDYAKYDADGYIWFLGRKDDIIKSFGYRVSPYEIERVYKSLSSLGTDTPSASNNSDRPQPAVPIRKSVMPDYIVCLEDGKKLKMLKRHLMTHYGLTPDAYRAKWNLPADYPMVAPEYAEKRRELAKKIGLGTKPRAQVNSRAGLTSGSVVLICTRWKKAEMSALSSEFDSSPVLMRSRLWPPHRCAERASGPHTEPNVLATHSIGG